MVQRPPETFSTVAVAGKKRPVMMKILRQPWQQRFGELHLEEPAVLGLLGRVDEPPHRSALDEIRAERHFSKVLDAQGPQGKQRNLERIAEMGCIATHIDDTSRLIGARHERDAKVDKSSRFLKKGTLSGGIPAARELVECNPQEAAIKLRVDYRKCPFKPHHAAKDRSGLVGCLELSDVGP